MFEYPVVAFFRFSFSNNPAKAINFHKRFDLTSLLRFSREKYNFFPPWSYQKFQNCKNFKKFVKRVSLRFDYFNRSTTNVYNIIENLANNFHFSKYNLTRNKKNFNPSQWKLNLFLFFFYLLFSTFSNKLFSFQMEPYILFFVGIWWKCFSSHLSKEDGDKLSIFRPSFFETTLDVGCHSCIAVLQHFVTNCWTRWNYVGDGTWKSRVPLGINLWKFLFVN